jgi:hypothetical protein
MSTAEGPFPMETTYRHRGRNRDSAPHALLSPARVSPDADIPPDEVCPPCRGTGQVISKLGGDPHPVECPWCHGTGRLPRPSADSNS